MPRDPNVRLPRAVKATVDAGEEAYRAVYGQPLNEDPPPGPDGDPPQDPQADPDDGPIRPPVGDPPQPEPSENVFTPARPNKPPAPPAPDGQSWEQRYRTLQGRHRADSDRFRQQISELEARVNAQATAMMEGSATITRLHNEIQELRRAPPPAPKPAKPTEVEFDLTPEEREQWSPEFLGLVKRAASAVVSAQIGAKDSEINELRSQIALLGNQVKTVDESTGEVAWNNFLAGIARVLPDWEEQNVDEDFKAWLELPDGFSGLTRKNSLDNAVAARNVAGAVSIFQGYRTELAAQGSNPPAPRPPSNGNGRVRLENLTAPRTTRQSPRPRQEAPTPPTAQEIRQFTSDVTRGKYRNREQERAAFQQRIDDLARASIRVATQSNSY